MRSPGMQKHCCCWPLAWQEQDEGQPGCGELLEKEYPWGVHWGIDPLHTWSGGATQGQYHQSLGQACEKHRMSEACSRMLNCTALNIGATIGSSYECCWLRGH